MEKKKYSCKTNEMVNYYSQERIENLSKLLPTYAAFLNKGDNVHLGIRSDPLFPETYRNSRPLGTVESVYGPEGSQVIAVRLGNDWGNQVAHCDVRSLNPYLSFQPEEATYQRIITSDRDTGVVDRLRSEMDSNEVVFRGMFSQTENAYRNAIVPFDRDSQYRGVEDSSLRREIDEVRAEMKEYKEQSKRAMFGIAKDIESMTPGEATYSGRLLQLSNERSAIKFRGAIHDDYESD